MNNTYDHVEDKEYTYSNIKLWNPKGFIFMGAFFSFFPAAILYSINYGRLGYKKERAYNLLGFSALFVILSFLAFYIESNIMKYVFEGLNIALSSYMRNKQMDLYDKHIENGGRKASYLLPASICLVILGLFIWAMIYSFYVPEKSLKIYDDELYYTERISDSEAEDIGRFLGNAEFFAKDNITINAGIDKNEKGYIFSLVVMDEAANNAELDSYMKEIGSIMSKQVLNSQPVRINLCNDRFKVIKTIQ